MASNFTEQCALSWVEDYGSADTTSLTSDSVDMANYRGVIFIAKFGTAAANNTLHAEQSSDDGAANTFADIVGSETGVGASDEIVWLEINNPTERYVRCVADRGTSTTLNSIVAIRHHADSQAVDNTTAGTIHGEVHIGAAEGTK